MASASSLSSCASEECQLYPSIGVKTTLTSISTRYVTALEAAGGFSWSSRKSGTALVRYFGEIEGIWARFDFLEEAFERGREGAAAE